MEKKILINTIPLLAKLTGVGKYIYEIASNLNKLDSFHYTYFYGYTSKVLISPKISEDKGKFDILSDFILKSNTLRTMLRKIIFSFSNFIPHKFDIYWEPNHILLPNISADIKITTIHDLSIIKYPEFHPLDRIRYFNKNIINTIRDSHHFITVSNFVKKEISEYFGMNHQKIAVIYNGFNENIFKKYPRDTLISFKNTHKLPENFILYVGTIEPRKNLKNLLLAYAQLPSDTKKNLKMVLAGYHGWENSDIFDIIKKDRENIKYIGYLEDKSLACLYNLSRILVYPSLYEGFGLPPLEAMACGTPVVTSNVSSMPEIYGDCAYYINPNDPLDIRIAIEKIIEDSELREKLIIKGENLAKKYSWEKSALEHLSLFKTLSNLD